MLLSFLFICIISSYSEPFVGNKRTKVYHYSWCRYAKRIKSQNRVYFNSWEEAVAAGYRPCKYCKPPSGKGVSSSATSRSHKKAVETSEYYGNLFSKIKLLSYNMSKTITLKGLGVIKVECFIKNDVLCNDLSNRKITLRTWTKLNTSSDDLRLLGYNLYGQNGEVMSKSYNKSVLPPITFTILREVSYEGKVIKRLSRWWRQKSDPWVNVTVIFQKDSKLCETKPVIALATNNDQLFFVANISALPTGGIETIYNIPFGGGMQVKCKRFEEIRRSSYGVEKILFYVICEGHLKGLVTRIISTFESMDQKTVTEITLTKVILKS